MQNIDDLANKLKQLPDQQREEVADFVDFLLSRHTEPTDGARILSETAGIWKEEPDGVTYEDSFRKQWSCRY